jgi:hypothetical protein
VTLREIFELIAEQNDGELTVEDALEQATAGDTPAAKELAERLEWDDSVAGAAWRKTQVAHMIRSVRMRVVFREADSETTTSRNVRTFHAVSREGSSGSRYESIEKIAEDPVSVQILMNQARREWDAMRRRYEHLEWFFRMVQEDVDQR